MIVEIDDKMVGKTLMPANPIKMSLNEQTYERAPLLGEHTDSYVKEIGFSQDDIRKLEAEGVLISKSEEE